MDSMKQLNEEFNLYRGLFPLKVFIGGPPSCGKSHFASKLAASYGIPHLSIAEMINIAKKQESELGKEIRAKIEELKDIEVAAYEKSKKKKDPDIVRDNIKVRLPEDILNRIVMAHVATPACMNKGFILDGYPRNQAGARAVFLKPIAGYEPPEDGAQADSTEFPGAGFEINSKIVPQYCLFIEAETDFLKQRVKELPPEKVEGTHHTEQHVDRRLKVYREANVDHTQEGHLFKYFERLIGAKCCKLFEGPSLIEEAASIYKMQAILEQNGKPCCINLITDGDNKFLAQLERKAKKAAQTQEAEEQPPVNLDEMTEEQRKVYEEEQALKAAQEQEEDIDEVDALIAREEEEHNRAEQEAAEKAASEAEAERERQEKSIREADKLEKIRQQERDLLDTRSQPIRQYLMDNVVPYLTEGLIDLCKTVPEDPCDSLADFLLARADQIDEQLIKEREEEIRKRDEAKQLAFLN